MDQFEWSNLNHLQLGRYGEYLLSMEFTKLGLSVFRAEVDDRGVDFVIRKDNREYYDVQVKSVLKSDYVFITEDKMPRELHPNFLVALAIFADNGDPDLYLIPATAWRSPNHLFRHRKYEGKKSKPEYGLNLSAKNKPLLGKYKSADIVKTIGLAPTSRP